MDQGDNLVAFANYCCGQDVAVVRVGKLEFVYFVFVANN